MGRARTGRCGGSRECYEDEVFALFFFDVEPLPDEDEPERESDFDVGFASDELFDSDEPLASDELESPFEALELVSDALGTELRFEPPRLSFL